MHPRIFQAPPHPAGWEEGGGGPGSALVSTARAKFRIKGPSTRKGREDLARRDFARTNRLVGIDHSLIGLDSR